MRPKEGLEKDERCGSGILNAGEIEAIGIEAITPKVKSRIGSNRGYISVKTDMLDPPFAP
jgi:arginase family enzyme